MALTRRKKILLVLLFLAALLAAGAGLFFALDGPERIARRALRTALADAGLDEFSLREVDVRLAGQLVLRDVALAGTIDAASDRIERLEIEADRLVCGFSWLGLFYRTDRAAKPPRSLTDWLPPSVSALEVTGGSVAVTLVNGETYRIAGLAGTLQQDFVRRLRASLAADRITREATAVELHFEAVALDGTAQGTALAVEALRTRHALGQLEAGASTPDLFALIEAATTATGRLAAADGRFAPASVPLALRAWRGAEAELRLRWTPVADLAPLDATAGWTLTLPDALEVKASVSGDGLSIEGSVDNPALVSACGRIDGGALPFRFADGVLVVGPCRPVIGCASPRAVAVPVDLTGSLRADAPAFPFQLTIGVDALGDLPALLESGLPLCERPSAAAPAWVNGNGTARLRLIGQLAPLQLRFASADVTLDLALTPPAVAGPLIVRGALRASLEHERLQLVTEALEVAGGTVDVTAAGRLRDATLSELTGSFAVRDLAFGPGRLLPEDSPLNATGVVFATGTFLLPPARPAEATVAAHVVAALADYGYGARVVGPATATADLRWDGDALFVDRLDADTLHLQGGDSRITANGRLGHDRTIEATLHARLDRDALQGLVSRIDGLPPDVRAKAGAMLELDAAASGTLDDPSATADVVLAGLAFWEITGSRLAARAVLAGNELILSDLVLSAEPAGATEAVTVRGAADVDLVQPPVATFRAAGDPLDLALLHALLPADWVPSGTAAVQVTGRWDRGLRELDVEFRAPELLVQSERAGDVALSATLREERLSASGTVGDCLGGALRAQLVADVPHGCRASLAAGGIDLTRVPGIRSHAGGVVSAEATATAALATADWTAHERIVARLRETYAAEARLAVAGAVVRGVTLEGLRAQVAAQAGRVEGVVRAASPALTVEIGHDLRARGAQVTGRWDALELSPLLGPREQPIGLSHTGTCDLVLYPGPVLEGEVSHRAVDLAVGGQRIALATPARTRFDGRRAILEEMVFTTSRFADPRLEVSGVVPLDANRAGLDLALRADDCDLSLLEGLSPVLRDAAGRIESAGRLTGSLADPTFVGDVRVRGGRVRLQGIPQGFTDAELVARVTPDRVILDRLEGRLGRGTVSATGELRMPPGALPTVDLHASFADVRYSGIPDLVVDGRGALRLHGDVTAPLLSGRVDLDRGRFTRSWDITDMVLRAPAVQRVAWRREAAWSPRLDVRLVVPGNLWVQNSLVAAECTGDVRFVGTLSRPSLVGAARIRRGTFKLPHGLFTVRQGSGVFEEIRPFFPDFTISGEGRQAGYFVTVVITGRDGRVSFAWSSSPPLSEEEIIHLLLTGSPKPSEEGFQSPSTTWALSRAFAYGASRAASEILPVDSVAVRPVSTEEGVESEVEISKRLSDRLTLRQQSYIGAEDAVAIGADYDLTRYLMLSGRARTGNVYSLDLVFELVF